MTSIATCGLITAATIFNGVLVGATLTGPWSRCRPGVGWGTGLGSAQPTRRLRKWVLPISHRGNWRCSFYHCRGGFFSVRHYCTSAGSPTRLFVYSIGDRGFAGHRQGRTAYDEFKSRRRLSALQKAFDGFRRWRNMRGTFQILAFLANVWVLVAVLIYIH